MAQTAAPFFLRRTGHSRGLKTLFAGLLLLVTGPFARGEELADQVPSPLVFYVGISKFCFRNVNRNDGVAAYRVFLENSGRRFGSIYKAEPRLFDDTSTFEEAIQNTPMHMAVMGAWQYLNMDIDRTMKPFFTVMENGQVGRKYLVLVRRNSGLGALADLRGKPILQLEMASADVGGIWLDARLLSENLGTQKTFFESVEVVAKPTAAILPVFFGKRPACLVDEPSFAVMKELNPQLGTTLEVLAASESFADAVICLCEDGWRSARDKSNTLQSMNELHLDPVGQQICTLFKIDRLVPFQSAQLDTIRTLRANYEILRKEKTP